MRDEGAVNFLVVCSAENVFKFLKHAQMVGMVIKKYSYFITSLVSLLNLRTTALALMGVGC